MKISAIKSIFTSPIKKIKQEDENCLSLSQFEKPTTSSLDCLSAYNQTLVTSKKEKALNLAKKIINDDSKEINVFDFGEYILGNAKGTKDSMPKTFFNVYFDNKNNIKNVFLRQSDPYLILVYDNNGKPIKAYDIYDTRPLSYYKKSSVFVTEKLRHNQDFGTDFQSLENTKRTINDLTEMFKDKTKHFINEEDTTLFRAMHLPIEEIGNVGDVFTDKSFVSTSTDLKIPKDFSKDCRTAPIMIIDFPKGAKYLDVDKLFNISAINWQEKEYLLNRDSQFLITKVDKKNNLVQATYILTDEETANLNAN